MEMVKNSNDENFEWVYKNHEIKNKDIIINFNYELETIVINLPKKQYNFYGGDGLVDRATAHRLKRCNNAARVRISMDASIMLCCAQGG